MKNQMKKKIREIRELVSKIPSNKFNKENGRGIRGYGILKKEDYDKDPKQTYGKAIGTVITEDYIEYSVTSRNKKDHERRMHNLEQLLKEE